MFYVDIAEGTCQSTPYPEGVEVVEVQDDIANAWLYAAVAGDRVVSTIDYDGFSQTLINIDE
jgi:hypothetical protein